MKPPLTPKQLAAVRKAGQARAAQVGPEGMRALGRLGGRPTWQESLRKAREREADKARKRQEQRREQRA